ncbi:MAG: C4-dicarboxylate ABC transporter substrate-binding protein [Desulfuromonadaceae bacterium GWC2_58_13]|nr:MAG: C4-dicarboxylate ABC transporter substrate-binding protein [Desulfuromonadaceae bacterium GWC2_58_13]
MPLKRFTLFHLFVAGTALLLSAFSPTGNAHAKSLTFSIFFPPTHDQAVAAMNFAQEVEKRTDGRIVITAFPGGTLTKAPQVYDGVITGISDLGNSCFAYTRGRFPVTAALDLPMGYPNGKVATAVADKFAKTSGAEELKDVKVLYVHAHGPGLLHTKKPVRSLEDLKGMKIRATGLSAKVVEALGAVPVAMPQGDTYEALQKGVVEGTFAPIETLKGWKQAEVIKYTTECYDIGYTTAMFVVMNLGQWNSLTEADRKILEEIAAEYAAIHGETWDRADQEGKEFTLSLGNELIPLSAEESARWRQAVEPVINDYISNTPNGAEYVQQIRTLITEASK